MSRDATAPVRTALCLCGGGITGGMFEVGALMALDDFVSAGNLSARPGDGSDGSASYRRFSVNEFDLYVGTSAGAFLATVLAGGMPIRTLFRAILDDDQRVLPAQRTDIFRFDLRQGFGIVRDLAGVLLSAAARSARRRLVRPGELLGDLLDVLPAGIFSLRHYEAYLERFFRQQALPLRFPDVPRELYISANDLDSGHRAIFGQGPLADAPLATAICASSAIPLFFEPVRYRGRDYIDGAVGKTEHADIALARGADLIIIVNPLVPFRNDPDREDLPTPLVGAKHLRDKGMLAVYAQSGKMSTRTKLHQGVRRYQASHPHATLLVIEPSEDEGDMFLHNPMAWDSRKRMVRYGYETTARLLADERVRYEAAFARHRVRVDSGRLSGPRLVTG